MKKILLVMLTLLLGACGTVDYVPEEYTIAKERIRSFDVNGEVVVENIQTDQNKVVFFGGAKQWVGDYKSVTQHLVDQLNKEIGIHGSFKSKNSKKTIQVKVISLNAWPEFFHFNSSLNAIVKLGDGTEIPIRVTQGSPGNMWRVLNGTIALAVIDILKNQKVRDYLAN